MDRPAYLITRRRHLGLTQAELARRSGVSQTYISRLERDAAIGAAAADRVVVALAAALKVHPAQLRFGPNPQATRATRREFRKRRARQFAEIEARA